MFFVCIIIFMYVGHSGVVRKYIRHSIVGKKSKIAAICSRSNNKLTLFWTE